MKVYIAFLTIALFPAISGAATSCSRMNLLRCLDSACAINAGSNPGARCQYCGHAGAGKPDESAAMKNVSVGASSKYTFTAKELKSAPEDPSDRYMWAIAECVLRVSGCTPDDAYEEYNEKIEKSCEAINVSVKLGSAVEQLNKKKTLQECSTDIATCVKSATECGIHWESCESDTDFDRIFSKCSVAATDCDAFAAQIRQDLTSARDQEFANASKLMNSIAESYRTNREKRINSAVAQCRDDSKYDVCIDTICVNHMRNRCMPGQWYRDEMSMAHQLCLFHKTACDTLLRKTNK